MGRFGELTLQQARAEALELHGRIRKGEDSTGAKGIDRTAPTMAIPPRRLVINGRDQRIKALASGSLRNRQAPRQNSGLLVLREVKASSLEEGLADAVTFGKHGDIHRRAFLDQAERLRLQLDLFGPFSANFSLLLGR